MKNKQNIFGSLLLFLSLASFQTQGAEVMYINPMQTALKKEPKMDATTVLTLVRGDAVTVLKKEGLWFYVSTKGKDGFLSKLFLNPNRPLGAADLIQDVKNEFKTSRAREVPRSVVASTRGLDASQSLSRAREGGMLFRVDFGSIDKLESLKISTDELNSFQNNGGLGQ